MRARELSAGDTLDRESFNHDGYNRRARFGADDSQTRRRFLTAATSAVGVGGVAGVAVPSRVMESFRRAAGAPVRADISKLDGQMVVIEWRGKPVYVLRRTLSSGGIGYLERRSEDPLLMHLRSLTTSRAMAEPSMKSFL